MVAFNRTRKNLASRDGASPFVFLARPISWAKRMSHRTDGLLWSPSRILGNFLIYRELDSREPSGRGTGLSAQDVSPRTGSARDRCLSSSTYRFKNNGLVKKTISLADMHIICYYRVNDVVDGRLRHPSSVPELLSLDISSALLLNQNFRIPVKVEVGPDGQARFAGEDEPSSVPSGNAFETTSHARKPSPAERRLSLDTSSRLQEAPQAVGPLVQAPPSMGGPSSSSTVAGPPYRPAAVRTYSGGPIGSQKQRYEPYPSRPSAQNTGLSSFRVNHDPS